MDAHARLLGWAQAREGKRDRKHEEGMWEVIFINSENMQTYTDIRKVGYNTEIQK